MRTDPTTRPRHARAPAEVAGQSYPIPYRSARPQGSRYATNPGLKPGAQCRRSGASPELAQHAAVSHANGQSVANVERCPEPVSSAAWSRPRVSGGPNSADAAAVFAGDITASAQSLLPHVTTCGAAWTARILSGWLIQPKTQHFAVRCPPVLRAVKVLAGDHEDGPSVDLMISAAASELSWPVARSPGGAPPTTRRLPSASERVGLRGARTVDLSCHQRRRLATLDLHDVAREQTAAQIATRSAPSQARVVPAGLTGQGWRSGLWPCAGRTLARDRAQERGGLG